MGSIAIYGHSVMTRIEFVIQPMREGIALPGERIWNGTFMKKGDMVGFLESVFQNLPVGAQLRLPRITHSRVLRERVAFNVLCPFTKVFFQAFLWLWIKVDENEALPGVGRNRRETVIGFFEVEEALFIWDEGKSSFQVVCPSVKLTRKILTRTTPVPDEFVTAVGAHIVKSPDVTIFAPDNQQ